jgi:hypothetical protein
MLSFEIRHIRMIGIHILIDTAFGEPRIDYFKKCKELAPLFCTLRGQKIYNDNLSEGT